LFVATYGEWRWQKTPFTSNKDTAFCHAQTCIFVHCWSMMPLKLKRGWRKKSWAAHELPHIQWITWYIAPFSAKRWTASNHCSMPFIDRTPDFKKMLLERENNIDVKRKKTRRREEPPRDDLGQLGKSYLREAYNVVSTWVENLMTGSDNSR